MARLAPPPAAEPVDIRPMLGVDEEFLLVDPVTGRPVTAGASVVESAGGLGVDLRPEITQVQVEVSTPACRGMREVRDHLLRMRSVAAAAAMQAGARLLAVGVPLIGPGEQPITDTPRFRRIQDDYGLLAAEHAVCGCRVRVAVPDRETAVQVSNHLRPWLPVLLALTANSPIHGGIDTGHASWRTMLNSRWPCSGPPPAFTSAEHYDSLVALMVGSGTVLDPGMVHWDVRLSPDQPAVEVRVGDVPATVDESVLVATLVRALVATAVQAVESGVGAVAAGAELLRMSYWRAAHDGMAGWGLDPFTSRRVPAPDLLHRLLRHVRPVLRETGEWRAVNTLVNRVLMHGNGAIRQRRVFRRRHDVAEVVELVGRHTVQDHWPQSA